MSYLPDSDRLDIAALSGLFRNTTNSYKYLFFLSLLTLIKERSFSIDKGILLRDIESEMLVTAWYPNVFFKLSFGTQDKISLALKQIQDTDNDRNVLSKSGRQTLRNRIVVDSYEKVQTYNFMRYVPNRILRPFFVRETKGMPDYLVDQKIPELAAKQFLERCPLFYFDESRERIFLHIDWIAYLERHQAIIEGWALWHWADYMQRRNPNIPAVTQKLFPPDQRESLNAQRKFWNSVIDQGDIRCIYTDRKICGDYELDHFLPWRFVAHDQLWNLIPVDPGANSSKSDQLPDKKYIDRLAETQHTALSIVQNRYSNDKWKKVVESYITGLHIEQLGDLLDRGKLKSAYHETLNPLMSTAKRQGFQSEWTYQGLYL